MKKKQENKKFEFEKTKILNFEKMKNLNGGTGNNDNCQDKGKSYLGTNGINHIP